MLDSAGLEAGHRVKGDGVDAVEDALFNVRVALTQTAQQKLDLFPLRDVDVPCVRGTPFRKAAGALDKLKAVVARPGDDVVFVYAVERADQRHALEVCAVQLRQHGLKLGAVEHADERRLDHIVEMVPKSDLVAAELLRAAVQVAPAHAGAEITGGLAGAVRNFKYIALEDRDGNVQKRRIALDFPAVELVVARVHHEKDKLKGKVAVLLQLLHELCQQHGVLAAGDAHGDPVAGLDHLVPLHRFDERIPQHLAVFCYIAALNKLIWFKGSCHGYASLICIFRVCRSHLFPPNPELRNGGDRFRPPACCQTVRFHSAA